MTRLEELIYALATVIVRYHDSQVDFKDKLVPAVESTALLRKKSHDRAIEIIQDTKTNFVPYLEGRIDACTKGYHGREEFLSFILNEIRFLKEQLDRKTPFEPKELQTLQEQLTQLFVDFRQLLSIKKGFKYPVTFNSSKASTGKELSGLLNDRYVGGKYCNSGQLLIEEVLFVLHMTTDDSNAELKDIATNLCLEQQTLLKQQNEKLKIVDEKENTQQSELETQKLELEKQKSELETQKLELEKQKSELDTQKLELEKQKSEFDVQKLLLGNEKSELETQILALKEQNNTLLATIEDSTKELEKTKAELQKAHSEAFMRRFHNPYLGLAGLNMFARTGTNPRFFQSTQDNPTQPTAEDLDEHQAKLARE